MELRDLSKTETDRAHELHRKVTIVNGLSVLFDRTTSGLDTYQTIPRFRDYLALLKQGGVTAVNFASMCVKYNILVTNPIHQGAVELLQTREFEELLSEDETASLVPRRHAVTIDEERFTKPGKI